MSDTQVQPSGAGAEGQPNPESQEEQDKIRAARDLARRRRQDLTNPLDKARSHRLLAVIKKEYTGAPPAKEPSTIVHVWPHLLMIEFLCAIVFTITLFITSILIYAPLEGIANSEQTPNPSKAPWYFLNLQELLLHMDPALAGVIIPGAALTLIALVPYFDLGPGQMGRWFTSDRGKSVVIFSAVYTVGWLIFLIGFDVLFNLNKILRSTPLSTIKVPIPGGDPSDKFGLAPTSLDVVLGNWLIPIAIIILLSALLSFLVVKRFGADRRDVFQALFTGFVMAYFITTIVGTAMRGPGQDFFWPWAMPPKH
jgi:hypothetical protein